MTYYVLWALVHHMAHKGSRDLLNANYVLLLFFFLRCGLKCRRGKRLWRNVNCTKGTNFEGQLWRIASINLPHPKIHALFLLPFVFVFVLFLFYFFYFLLLSAVWNSASWRWTCNNTYPFWNKMCRLWKDLSFSELIQVAFLSSFVM